MKSRKNQPSRFEEQKYAADTPYMIGRQEDKQKKFPVGERRTLVMDFTAIRRAATALPQWTPPALGDDIPHGDMPGDKVEITKKKMQRRGGRVHALRRQLSQKDSHVQ